MSSRPCWPSPESGRDHPIGNGPNCFSVVSTIAVFTCCTESCGKKHFVDEAGQVRQAAHHDLDVVVHLTCQRISLEYLGQIIDQPGETLGIVTVVGG
jgi:hypothetical protein